MGQNADADCDDLKRSIMSTQTIAVHLPDGAIREVPAGTTPLEIANSISPRLAAVPWWRG
jgi:(p)ppGpp synthase/HD superfamily hydrolase